MLTEIVIGLIICEGVIGLIISVMDMDMLGVQSNKLNGSLEIEVSQEG